MTPGIEEYLEAIYHLQDETKSVSTKKLADYLKIAPPSVTDMIKKLAQKKLVNYVPYKGVKLTKKGLKEATDLIRKHRLSEVFLADLLGMPWEEVHEEACHFEHVISNKVEKRMVEVLGNPKTCPHGNPIPKGKITLDQQENDRGDIKLTDLPVGKEAKVSRIIGEGTPILSYLKEIGVEPGERLIITKSAPFKGPFMIKIKGSVYPLSRKVANQIFVK